MSGHHETAGWGRRLEHWVLEDGGATVIFVSVLFVLVSLFALAAVNAVAQSRRAEQIDGQMQPIAADSAAGIVYRLDDPERGVTCYVLTGGGIDCIPTQGGGAS